MPDKHNLTYFLEQDSFRNWALGLDEGDCAYWDAWIASHPDQAETAHLAAAVAAGVLRGGPSLTDAEVEQEWLKIQKRLQTAPKREAKQVWFFDWRTIAAAASVVVLLGVLFGWYALTPVTEVYATASGQKKDILLADGSLINLSPNSTLKTKAVSPWAPAREIWLEGEAYFNVKSHPDDASIKKFVVHTHGLDVNVLGTQFNVKARSVKTRVFLNEGKIRVTLTEPQEQDTLYLLPGDLVTYEPKAGKAHKVSRKTDSLFIDVWKGGYYTFNKTPLAEVFRVVESTHDLKIRLEAPQFMHEPLTGRVATGNLGALFASIANLYDLSYTRRGDTVVFTPKHSASPNH